FSRLREVDRGRERRTVQVRATRAGVDVDELDRPAVRAGHRERERSAVGGRRVTGWKRRTRSHLDIDLGVRQVSSTERVFERGRTTAPCGGTYAISLCSERRDPGDVGVDMELDGRLRPGSDAVSHPHREDPVLAT